MINILTTTTEGICGQVPDVFFNLVHYVILAIQVVVPLLLIIFGMLDMAKAVTGNDDKEMKEAQKKLIRRIIYAVIVFLIVALVKFTVSIVSSTAGNDGANTSGVWDCVNKFVAGASSGTAKQ